MVSGDLTPDSSHLGSGLLSLGLVNISDSLSEVELGLVQSGDTLDLQDGVVGLLVTLTLGVSSEDSLGVETGWFTGSCNAS